MDTDESKREYVKKEMSNQKIQVDLDKIIIQDNVVSNIRLKSYLPSKKGKLIITDLGILVNQYMDDNFDKINSYQFTSDINDKLDNISNGNIVWFDLVKQVYETFSNRVRELKQSSSHIMTNEKILLTHEDVEYSYYRDRYGICLLKKWNNEEKKVRINSLDTLTVDKQSLEGLFKFPILLGNYQEQEVYLKNGKYGLYTEINGEKISVENENITINQILEKIKKKKNNVIKEWKNIKILQGPYGPYIRKGTNTVSIPDQVDLEKISLTECEILFIKLRKKKYKK